MPTDKNKLALWERVQETNPLHTKTVGFGKFSFTSINAQYQLKNATEQFGAYGKGWGISALEYEFIHADGLIMALAKAQFFAGDSVFPISSTIMVMSRSKTGDLRLDDEWAKKVETDITTKALSKLGFNADVFLGRYDDNRYVNDLKKKFAEVPQKFISDNIYNELLPKIAEADKAAITKTEKWMKDFNVNDNKSKLEALITERKKQL